MTNDDLRGLTEDEIRAVAHLDNTIGNLSDYLTIRAALSRVPVAGEAVALTLESTGEDERATAGELQLFMALKDLKDELESELHECDVCGHQTPMIAFDVYHFTTKALDEYGAAPPSPPADDARDAARYRWLRGLSDPDGGIPHVVTLEDREPIVHVHLCYGDDLDTAIDAAMSADQTKGASDA